METKPDVREDFLVDVIYLPIYSFILFYFYVSIYLFITSCDSERYLHLLFTHLLILFIYLSIFSYFCSLRHVTLSATRTLIYIFIYLFIYSYIHSFICFISFIYSFIYLFVYLFIYSFIYLFVLFYLLQCEDNHGNENSCEGEGISCSDIM